MSEVDGVPAPIRVQLTASGGFHDGAVLAVGSWFAHPHDAAVLARPGREGVEHFPSLDAAIAAYTEEFGDETAIAVAYLDSPERLADRGGDLDRELADAREEYRE